jgi:hypothetical protein
MNKTAGVARSIQAEKFEREWNRFNSRFQPVEPHVWEEHQAACEKLFQTRKKQFRNWVLIWALAERGRISTISRDECRDRVGDALKTHDSQFFLDVAKAMKERPKPEDYCYFLCQAFRDEIDRCYREKESVTKAGVKERAIELCLDAHDTHPELENLTPIERNLRHKEQEKKLRNMKWSRERNKVGLSNLAEAN